MADSSAPSVIYPQHFFLRPPVRILSSPSTLFSSFSKTGRERWKIEQREMEDRTNTERKIEKKTERKHTD